MFWTKWHWNRVFSKYCCFSLPLNHSSFTGRLNSVGHGYKRAMKSWISQGFESICHSIVAQQLWIEGHRYCHTLVNLCNGYLYHSFGILYYKYLKNKEPVLFQHKGGNGSLCVTVIWFIEAKSAGRFIVTWKLLWQDWKWWMQTLWILNTCLYIWCTILCRNINMTRACTARFICGGAGRWRGMC
jgi:hypothetical protein